MGSLKSNVRIESDGISTRTVRVTVGGVQINAVSRIVIEPMGPDGVIKATIEVIGPILDIQADAEISGEDGGS